MYFILPSICPTSFIMRPAPATRPITSKTIRAVSIHLSMLRRKCHKIKAVIQSELTMVYPKALLIIYFN